MTIDSSYPDVPFAAEPIARPEVADRRRPSRGWLGYGAVLAAGGIVLLVMSTQREAANGAVPIGSGVAAPSRFTTPEPLPADARSGGTLPGVVPPIAAPQFTTDNAQGMPPLRLMAGQPMIGPPVRMAANSSDAAARAVARLTSPALVVDLSDAAGGVAPGGMTSVAKGIGGAPLVNPALTGTPAKPGASAAEDTGQFLQGVSMPSQPARAGRIGEMDSLIAEGTVMSATLETAINSDLPGFARAVISRNVMSFDGTRLLVPRGSRVIGQYKSGVAMGASRVFVIWTRLIRPDGVTIQLVSPSSDDLGRGGVAGKVNRHFLQRFGGAILTSVLNGAVSLGTAALGNGVPVYINSVAEAGAAATSASQTGDIPPTVKTMQGTSLKIFVARDLDFTGMELPE